MAIRYPVESFLEMMAAEKARLKILLKLIGGILSNFWNIARQII